MPAQTTTTTNTSSDTISQGFDLDALAASSAGADDEVVYELGGGATVIPAATTTTTTKTAEQDNKEDDTDQTAVAVAVAVAVAAAEEYKQRGNDEFKAGHYLEAYDFYTMAIDRCPCQFKGDVILKLQQQHDKAQREKSYRTFQQQQKEEKEEASSTTTSTTTNNHTDTTTSNATERSSSVSKPAATAATSEHIPFVVPKQPHSESLAIYYCNRAASQWYLAHYDAVIQDATVAILLNPKYAKAFVRRSMAHESLDRIDSALVDMKQAQMLEPTNKTIATNVKRLQTLEDKRLEVLKEETIGKLKDLGNSLLSNFGLSLDNFKTVQDPKTGSYNIQFEQGGGGGNNKK